MKKIATVALVIGLLAVPSVAAAMHGADNINHAADIRQEDRHQVLSATTATTNSADVTTPPAQVTTQTQTTTNTGVTTHTTEAENEMENENEGNVTLPAGSISLTQATTVAQAVFPGKTVSRVETETEDGTVIFSVRFTDGSRVDVKAADGTVLRSRTASSDGDNSGSNNSGQDHDQDN